MRRGDIKKDVVRNGERGLMLVRLGFDVAIQNVLDKG